MGNSPVRYGTPFSARELQVLEHLKEGHSPVKIGMEMGLADGTIRSHIYRACRKVGVHSQLALVVKVLKRES